MPKYRITSPDGRTFEISAPEGASQDEVLAYAQSNFGSPDQPKPKEPEKGLLAQFGDYAVNNTMGTLRGLKDVVDTGAQYLASGFDKVAGTHEGERVKAMNDAGKLDFQQNYGDSTAASIGRLGGNVLATLPVGGAIGAGVKAGAQALNAPRIAQLAEAISTGGMRTGANPVGAGAKAADMATRMAGGAITGGATAGLINPDDAGLGAGIGAALPPALKAAGAAGAVIGKVPAMAKSVVEPFYEGGQQAIVGRVLREAAGDSADDVLRNLDNTAELVPGVQATTAELAQNPGIAALSRAAPDANAALRQEANNAARNAAIDGLVPDRAAALEARDLATRALYEQSSAAPVQVTTELEALLQRPSMQAALKRAETLAGEAGETFDLSNLTGRGAQYLKMALDDLANASPATGIGGNELRAVRGTRNQFIDQLGEQIPEYLQANKSYAELSAPLNQADVIEGIASKGRDFRGNLTPSKISNAISDSTVARITGRPGATLESTLTPDQLDILDRLRRSLLQRDYAQTAGKAVGSNTVQNLAYSNMIDRAGIPSGLRDFAPASAAGNVLSRFMDAGYGRANSQLSSRLAEALANPSQAAEAMRATQAIPRSQSQWVQELIRGMNESTYRGAPAISAQN